MSTPETADTEGGQADSDATADKVDSVATAPTPIKDTPLSVTKRLMREGRWKDLEPLRDQMMSECRKQGMSKQDAQAWTYTELGRMYPPLPRPEPLEAKQAQDTAETAAAAESEADNGAGDSISSQESVAKGYAETNAHAHARESHLQGLGEIPAYWPELPDNAALPAELSWVQAQRLRVVEERSPGVTVVHLERAGSPAPSWAALGWLETSIRSYAKFVDICAKGLGQHELESDMVRRERRSIEEVRRLLAEMLDQ